MKRQLRWFDPRGAGYPVTRRELEALPSRGRVALLRALHDFSRGATDLSDLRHLGNGLYEVRVSAGADQFRAVLFQDSPVHYVIVRCFAKKQRKTPRLDLAAAKERQRLWYQRR